MNAETPQPLRQLNRSRILDIILAKGATSRTDIAEQTGLSKVTTTAIINELVAEKVLLEVGKTEGNTGRPAALVELHHQAGTVLALDTQPSHLDVLESGLADKKAQEQTVTFANRKQVTRNVLETLNTTLQAANFGALSQVVISMPAPVGVAGLPMKPNSLPELEAAKILAWSEKNNISLVLENDIKLAAIAEHTEGSAKGVDNFALLLERTTGVALGLFLGGRLYRGERGLAGELPLVRWPHKDKLIPLEELPASQRATALSQLVSGLAVALDLSLLVVHQTSSEVKSLNLVKALQTLVPENVRVTGSDFADRGPVRGAWLEAKRLAQEALLSSAVYTPNGALNQRRKL